MTIYPVNLAYVLTPLAVPLAIMAIGCLGLFVWLDYLEKRGKRK